MTTPTREQKIYIQAIDSKHYQISDRDGNVLLNSNDDYFIYFKHVNFRKDGKMDGRFLGENPQTLIDRHCKKVEFVTNASMWIQEDNQSVRTARMVAINNKTGAIIIIQND